VTDDDLAAVLDVLVPWPDDGTRADAPVAVDATDRLLLEEARDRLTSAGPREVVAVGDRFGALTLGARALGARDVRVHTDAVDAEEALLVNADRAGGRGGLAVHAELGAELLDGAGLVLLQLPKSLAELTEIAELVARYASDDVVLLAGGRLKHMTRSMNDVLAASFTDVRATLARGKSRALVATGPRPERRDGRLTYPVRARLTDAALVAAAEADAIDVVAHGAVFAGPALDHGTRLLLGTADRWAPADAVRDAVDLGCGTGLLAVVLARRYPGARVVATDRSAAAVASARATAVANGVADRIEADRDDAGARLPDASADVMVLNPPFHDRAAVSTDAAHRMFAAAGRVLRPGGELWCVFNTPLRHRPALERAVGPTEHVAQDRRFTVTRSVRR
jgi:16S rRNA (guanine1207-N2)-methyltransferase